MLTEPIARIPARAVAGADRRRFVPSPGIALLLMVAGCGLLAFAVRATGLRRANDLFVDELTYASFADQVAHGQLPRTDWVPFFLHPPASMVLNGLVIKIFGLSGSAMGLVYDLRWVNATLGSCMVVLAFLILRQLVSLPIALGGTLVLALDPFVLRNDSRVMIETPATLLLMAGWCVLLAGSFGRPLRRGWLVEVAAGLLLGTALVTKDMTAVPGLATLVVAVLFRRTVQWDTAVRVIVPALIPYTVYLLAVNEAGQFPAWWAAKTFGIRRMVGLEQTTGFNATPEVHLATRLIAELPRFGTSYLLLALCLPAGVVALTSGSARRRFIGIIAVCTGCLGAYAVAGGAAEEQFGYYVLVTSVLALAVTVAELVERWPGTRAAVAATCAAFIAITAFLGASARFVVDDGYPQARAWMSAHLPPTASIGVTGVTAEFAFPKYHVSPSLLELRDNNDRYALTASQPLSQGYGYAAPALLDWLSQHARPVFTTNCPTNGAIVLWELDRPALIAAVDSGTLIPAVSRG